MEEKEKSNIVEEPAVAYVTKPNTKAINSDRKRIKQSFEDRDLNFIINSIGKIKNSKLRRKYEERYIRKSSMDNNDNPLKKIIGEYQSALDTQIKEMKSQHSPIEMQTILSMFSGETALKYSTHSWDAHIDSYEKFINGINVEKEKLDKIKKLNTYFYWNVLYDFLYRSKPKPGEDSLKWGRHKLNIGWQYPDKVIPLLCKSDRPFSIRIPKLYREKKRVNNVTLTYFENYVNIFKEHIEFRGVAFKKMLESLANDMNEFKIDWTDFNIDSVDFYTSTWQVEIAIKKIFENMKSPKRRLNRDIKISGHMDTEMNSIQIEILHKNSYSDKSLNDKKLQIEVGEFRAIRKILVSLCDWSVESRFKDIETKNVNDKKCYRINYLCENNDIPIIQEIDSVDGFKHILKFRI